MEENLKCKICGNIFLLSIVVATNYPICKKCLLQLKEHPDVPTAQRQFFGQRQIFIGGISSTASTMSFDTFDNDQWRNDLLK